MMNIFLTPTSREIEEMKKGLEFNDVLEIRGIIMGQD
jgi:hypothetical protein